MKSTRNPLLSRDRSTGSSIEALEARIAPAAVLGLNEANTLLLFDSTRPGEILATIPVTGLAPSAELVGIDFRPFDGALYGIARVGLVASLYSINTHSGSATL